MFQFTNNKRTKNCVDEIIFLNENIIFAKFKQSHVDR